MKNRPLSIIPYYGGKARMAKFIANMLDYDNTDIYIEPFGGGGRTILNKPQHKKQIYNDSSAGLCAIFELLSNENTAMEFIEKLCNTEYTEEEFNKAISFRNMYEDNYLEETVRQIKIFINRIEDRGIILNTKEFYSDLRDTGGLNANLQEIFNNAALTPSERVKVNTFEEDFKLIQEKFSSTVNMKDLDIEVKDELDSICNDIISLANTLGIINNNINKQFVIEHIIKTTEFKRISKFTSRKILQKYFYNVALNTRDEAYDKIDIAVATYVIYWLSRDGMGQYYSKGKFRNNQDYLNKISKLLDCANVLQWTKVTQVDAIQLIATHINNERAMIYCDPTYLKHSNNVGTDLKNIKDVIRHVGKQVREYNPGAVYKHYWTRIDHENFLRLIQKAKCKVLVSNYRDERGLYDYYLNTANNWKSLEFETVTSISKSKNSDNSRTEVLWYNY